MKAGDQKVAQNVANKALKPNFILKRQQMLD